MNVKTWSRGSKGACCYRDFEIYNNQPVIIKGCAKKPIPEEAYVMATQKMMKHARSIMFGEACSAVPIYKKKK